MRRLGAPVSERVDPMGHATLFAYDVEIAKTHSTTGGCGQRLADHTRARKTTASANAMQHKANAYQRGRRPLSRARLR
ncbi:hypothetical protein BURKHO8Y_30241 [Burkholderia sp. 8Y]|nr:hypothetical protein BURKHO8Y_30241 [Burkholderia sp. 8Y]